MKLRNGFALFLIVFLAACGGAEQPAETTEPEPAAEPAAMDDEAMLDEQMEYFVTHYNMHHADMVAETYAEDAVGAFANATIADGREALAAYMAQTMEQMSPTLALETGDRMIFGDVAITRGRWELQGTVDGEATTADGHFLTFASKTDGEWKNNFVVTNYDEAPPADYPWNYGDNEAPPDLEDSPLAELTGYYATHFNMGHGGMVASRYTEDAVAAVANMPLAVGRDAIEAQLTERIETLGGPSSPSTR